MWYQQRKTPKISTLSSPNNAKYKHLISEEILPSNQRQTMELGKFTYSPLRKTFGKQTKTIEEQGKKQIIAIRNHNETLEAFANKNMYKEILDKVVKEKNWWNKRNKPWLFNRLF